MTQQELLDQLETDLRAVLAVVRENFVGMPPEALRQRQNPESWNALECVAHLNRYTDDYIPRLHRAIHLAKARRWAPGNAVRYTARGRRLLRRADAAAGKTYKTAKRYNFLNLPLEKEVLKAFIINCEQLLRILQEARKVDLNRPTVRKANAWFGRYTLGNILEFIVLHNKRHTAQAMAILRPA
ncbi:MAG: DinB family protein [Lewinellaceae bacterium]|nr:DinB family protein [Lewinellaceae bacterium]